MEIAFYIVGLWFLAWVWYQVYNTFLACWIPSRAKPYWLSHVNALGGRFFSVFRWTSPTLLLFFSLIALLNTVLVFLVIWRKFAS
jgi:hypothetical protein